MIARKGRNSRLVLIDEGGNRILVPIRRKAFTHTVPRINISNTESPNEDPEFDEEGGFPQRELNFSILLVKEQKELLQEGTYYDVEDYVGSKDIADAYVSSVYIESISSENDEAESESAIEYSVSAVRSGALTRPTRA